MENPQRKQKKTKKKQGSKKSNGNQGTKVVAVTTMPTHRPGAGFSLPRGSTGNLVTKVCSLLDPFCNASIGTRFPDGQAGNTISYRVTRLRPIATSGALVNGAFLFCPDPSKFFYIAPTLVTSATTTVSMGTTIPGEDTAFSTVLDNFGGELRIVSAGARWVPLVAATTAGVPFCLTEINDTQSLVTNPATSVALEDLTGGTNVVISDSRQPFTFISKRLDMMANNFQDASANNVRSGNWSGLLVTFENAPVDTTLGFFEIVINVEINVKTSTSVLTGLSRFANRPPPAAPLVVRAMKSAQEKVSSILPMAGAAVERMLEGAARVALTRLVGGPGGAAALALANAVEVD